MSAATAAGVFRSQFPIGEHPQPLVAKPLYAYGDCTTYRGSELVFDMSSSATASSSKLRLPVLFDRLLALNKQRISTVLESPLQPLYVDPDRCTAKTYCQTPKGVPWTNNSKPMAPVFATVCTTRGQKPCKCLEVPSDCVCPVGTRQIAKPEVQKGDSSCDGTRIVPPNAPEVALLAELSGTLGLGSAYSASTYCVRRLLYLDPRIPITEGMRIRLEQTPEETKANVPLPRLVLGNVGSDGGGTVLEIEPKDNSVYILPGEEGNCRYLHAIVGASKGKMLAKHRDSSSILRAEGTGKRAMPDFTLVTTHVGVIEVGGMGVGRARVATVYWGYSCRLKPVQRGVPADSDSDSDSE